MFHDLIIGNILVLSAGLIPALLFRESSDYFYFAYKVLVKVHAYRRTGGFNE